MTAICSGGVYSSCDSRSVKSSSEIPKDLVGEIGIGAAVIFQGKMGSLAFSIILLFGFVALRFFEGAFHLRIRHATVPARFHCSMARSSLFAPEYAQPSSFAMSAARGAESGVTPRACSSGPSANVNWLLRRYKIARFSSRLVIVGRKCEGFAQVVNRAICIALADKELRGGVMSGGHFRARTCQAGSRIGFEPCEICEINGLVVDYQAGNVFIAEDGIHFRSGDRAVPMSLSARMHSGKIISVNPRDDGLSECESWPPAAVSYVTRSPSSLTTDATMRPPFFRTMVSALAEDTASARRIANAVTGRTLLFYQRDRMAHRPARCGEMS